MLHANKFRERQFKAHHARQNVINRAEHGDDEKAINLQLRLRHIEPGELRQMAELRTRRREQPSVLTAKMKRSQIKSCRTSRLCIPLFPRH